MPSLAEIENVTPKSKILASPRVVTDEPEHKGAKAVDPNKTVAFEAHRNAVMALGFALLFVLIGWLFPIMSVILLTFGLPLWGIIALGLGQWSAAQFMIKATTPGSTMWRLTNAGYSNSVLVAGFGFLMLPVVVGLIIPGYWIGRLVHMMEIKGARSSDDPVTRQTGEYYELGRRHHWFKQVREAKRRQLTGDDYGRFLLATSIGAFVPASQIAAHFNSVDEVPSSELNQFINDMTAMFGLPKY